MKFVIFLLMLKFILHCAGPKYNMHWNNIHIIGRHRALLHLANTSLIIQVMMSISCTYFWVPAGLGPMGNYMLFLVGNPALNNKHDWVTISVLNVFCFVPWFLNLWQPHCLCLCPFEFNLVMYSSTIILSKQLQIQNQVLMKEICSDQIRFQKS